MRQTTIRQLLDAEATRLLETEPDLGPRIVAALAAERRRSRERRLTLATAAAGALLVAWLGAAPIGGALRLTGDLAVPTARAAETPQPAPPEGPGTRPKDRVPGRRLGGGYPAPGTRTPTAVAPTGGPAGAATATATTTSTPSPAR